MRLRVGPMFSGKTSHLLSLLEVAAWAELPAALARPAADTRWEGVCRSHSGASPPEAVRVFRVPLLAPLASDASLLELRAAAEAKGQPPVIAVDEGQFFPDLAAGARALAAAGFAVLVVGLDGDARQRPFPAISELLPHCDSVEKQLAVCGRCRRAAAPFTVRSSSAASAENEQVSIGGAEKYQARCRACLESGDGVA